MTSLTLALDTMGGDFGPRVTVPAALQVLASNVQLHLLLVGNPDALSPLLAKADPVLLARLQVIPAESMITGDAKPSQAIRASRGTSKRIALDLINDNKVQGCVSAGQHRGANGTSEVIDQAAGGY